jgi:hypothetical protein
MGSGTLTPNACLSFVHFGKDAMAKRCDQNNSYGDGSFVFG